VKFKTTPHKIEDGIKKFCTFHHKFILAHLSYNHAIYIKKKMMLVKFASSLKQKRRS